ncbi:MAG: hypothetical protein R2736_21325 [Solirubrobacterales bacterium]
MTRHRRPPLHPRLRAKRRKVQSQTKALVKRVKRDLASPSTANDHKAAGSVTQLRKTLHDVRHDVLRGGAGDHTRLVAGALGDLDHSLTKLSSSLRTADPNARLQMLAEAKHALDMAQAKARKAGHDWPL